MYISHHSLRINQRAAAHDFYCNKLGMHLLRSANSHQNNTTLTHDFLAFTRADQTHVTQLELISSPAFTAAQKTNDTGYWKIGVTLPDVDTAVDSLMHACVAVSAPKQFRDIGYLCHLDDPFGNSIELLQHWFAQNKPTQTADNTHVLGSQATFGQITLRIKDPAKSLSFYRDALGMRLLSRQVVEPYQFTLYFLAFCDEDPPIEDIDAVENREWLWQRPYTTLELQHRWGTENSAFNYDTSPASGFECLTIADADLTAVGKKLKQASLSKPTIVSLKSFFDAPALHVSDPDGYIVRFLEGFY